MTSDYMTQKQLLALIMKHALVYKKLDVFVRTSLHHDVSFKITRLHAQTNS